MFVNRFFWGGIAYELKTYMGRNVTRGNTIFFFIKVHITTQKPWRIVFAVKVTITLVVQHFTLSIFKVTHLWRRTWKAWRAAFTISTVANTTMAFVIVATRYTVIFLFTITFAAYTTWTFKIVATRFYFFYFIYKYAYAYQCK